MAAGAISPSTLLSLAAGVLPEFDPEPVVHAAADAGFAACGVWFDPDTWTANVGRQVRNALDSRGLVALDMEPVFVTPKGDHGDRLIDAAAEIGARNVLVVSRGVAAGPFAERFGELCDSAAPAGISICVEFGRLFGIEDLPAALAVVAAVDRDNAGVLVDNLHLARSGGTADDVRRAPNDVFPYAQLCDAPPAGGEGLDELRNDALDGRLNLGEGTLPVADVWRALPHNTPISLEVRSAALRENHPDPGSRARSVLAAATRYLTQAHTR